MAQAEQAAPVPPATAAHVDAARPRVFYGWWIVLGAIVAQFIAMGQNQLTNVILGPMTRELGWTRSEFTIAATIGTVLSGMLGFVIGAQVDRRGARPLILFGTVISSAALIAISFVDQLWEFWALRGVALVLGNVMVGNLVVNVTISKWFVDRRGWAISMAALGVSSWSLIGTQLIGFVVDGYGWRAGWIGMGAATWILLPIALVMVRQPEDRGLLPDGRHAADAATDHGRAALARALADSNNSLTRGEAARTPALWLLILAFGLALTGMTALFAHLIQFFVDVGFTPSEARYFYSLQGGFSLVAKFVWGGAMQRLPARTLVATSFTMAAVATLGLVYTAASQPWPIVAAFAALWGLATGGMIPLSEFVWASYFGRRHIGAVRGLGLPFTVLLTAGGPLFASEVFDRTGSYNLAMVIFAAMWFAGALLILVARRPSPRSLTVPLAQRLRQPVPTIPPPAPHAVMAAVLAAAGDAPAEAVLQAAVETATRPGPRDYGVELAHPPTPPASDASYGAPPRHGARRPGRSYMGLDAAPPPSALPPAPLASPPAPAPPRLAEVPPRRPEALEPVDVPASESAAAPPLAEAPPPAPPSAPPSFDSEPALEPVDLEPFDGEPVDCEPVDREDVDAESVGAESVDRERALEHVDREPVALDAASAHPASAEPANAEPDGSPPVDATNAQDGAAGATAIADRSPEAPVAPPPAEREPTPVVGAAVVVAAAVAPPSPEAPVPAPRALTPSPPRPPARFDRAPLATTSPWVPRSTGEAIFAGIVATLVATAALWFLTRPEGDDRPS